MKLTRKDAREIPSDAQKVEKCEEIHTPDKSLTASMEPRHITVEDSLVVAEKISRIPDFAKLVAEAELRMTDRERAIAAALERLYAEEV